MKDVIDDKTEKQLWKKHDQITKGTTYDYSSFFSFCSVFTDLSALAAICGT